MKKTVVLCLFIVGFFSCQSPYPTKVETALQQAKSHRNELERVIQHYQGDSLKLQAAYFLFSSLPLHYTYDSQQKAVYDSALFSSLACIPDSIIVNLSFTNPLVNHLMDSLDGEYGSLRDLPLYKQPDIRSVSAIYLIKHIDQAFAAWKTYPWARDYNFEQFCEYILPHRVSNEPLEDWRTTLVEAFTWLPDSLHEDSLSKPIEICNLINRNIHLTANIGFSRYPVAQPLSAMQQGQVGTCQEQVDLAMFAMRSYGLAVAHDFTPMYANYHTGHDWNALITPDRKSYDFMGTFRSTAQHYLWWKAAKVYRQTYSAQSEFLVNEKNIPPFFQRVNMKDVTAGYFPVSDITITLPSAYAEHTNVAYLCTFADREWYPIHWGRVTGTHEVTFTDMGRGYRSEDTTLIPVADDLLYFTQINEGAGIVYTPMAYEDKQLHAAGPAMILTLEGTTKLLIPYTTQQQTLTLFRKYPETLRKQEWRKQMVGGVFQGANRADFSDAQELFTVSEMPGEHPVTISPVNNRHFRYVRFLISQDTINSVAEVAFYGQKDELLQGNLIYQGNFSLDGPPKAATDGNPLTYAEGLSGNNYIGWDLQRPTSIKKITYIARNDGNAIQPGDRYELLYWNQKWVSLGKKKADTTFLTYPGVPKNALFWLRNLSNGREERIFTYEGNKQIWW